MGSVGDKSSKIEAHYELTRQCWACPDCGGMGHNFTPGGCMTCKTCEPIRKAFRDQCGAWNTIDIEEPAGTRVVFHYGLNGQDYDIRKARELLQLGTTYTVDRSDAGDYSSSVYLREFPGVRFNTVQFTPEAS